MLILLCCIFVLANADLLLYNYTNDAFLCFPNGNYVDLPPFMYCNNFGYSTNESFVDIQTPYILNETQIIWYWNLLGVPHFFTFNGLSYKYHDQTGTITLSDCDYIQTDNIAWDPVRTRFWLIVHSIIFNNTRLFYIDRLSRATGYSSILTGEKPQAVFWNGTEILAVISRNQTYYSIPFLNSNKVRMIGLANGTMLDFSNNSVNVYPIPENTTKICQFYCPIPKIEDTSYPSLFSSVFNTSETSSYELNQTSIENSTTYPESSTMTSIPTSQRRINSSTKTSISVSFQYVYSNTDIIDVSGGPRIINGIMYVPPGSYLDVYFPPESLSEGTTITVFTFSQLVGQFDYIGLQQTSCYVFDTRTTYGTNAITISILSASNTCDNAPIKSVF